MENESEKNPGEERASEQAEERSAQPVASEEKPSGNEGKKKKKKKKKSKKPTEIGSSKAVDTMFRNAYRAELDIISLAATEVNIMISLNGFIISALVISGALVFSSSPEFLVPAGCLSGDCYHFDCLRSLGRFA